MPGYELSDARTSKEPANLLDLMERLVVRAGRTWADTCRLVIMLLAGFWVPLAITAWMCADVLPWAVGVGAGACVHVLRRRKRHLRDP